MVNVSQQSAPSQTWFFRIRLQRYRKLHLHFLRKEIKQIESTKNPTCSKRTVFLDGSQALIYILFLIKVHSSLIHPSTPLSLTLFPSRSYFSVGEALAGFFPAAGGAPLILALHSVHFAALFGLAATLPADIKTQIVWMRSNVRGREKKGCCQTN